MPSSPPTSSAGGTEAVDDLFATHDALAVAELVKTRKLGARELLDGTLNRLRALNASLNAVTDFYEGALLEKSVAAAGEGPFQGVPFVVKQLMADCAGTPTTLGSRFFAKEPVAANDSAAVARMRRAGLVIVGRTNTSEFGLAPTTEPAFGGATVNPWRKDLSPGGSSGGSAAVVAARGLPMAHATDGGGSIRIPASLCGLFGLKPSRGRVSLAPIGETLAGAGAQHCVSISVRDSAALLDAMAGGEPGDPYRAPPAGSFLAATQRPPGRLRVAFMRKPVGGGPLDPVLVAAVERTAKLLEELGHHVEEAAPDYDAAATGAAFGTVMCANTFTNIQVRADGRVPGPDDLEPVTRLHAERGRGISAHDYIRAVQTFHRTGRQLGAVLREARRAAVAHHRAHASCRWARCGWTARSSSISRVWRRWSPSPRCATPPACRPCRCRWPGRTTACRSACISSAASARRRCYSRWRPSSSSAAPWRDRRPPGGTSHEQSGCAPSSSGFIAGALSVLIFHQLGFWIANELGLLPAHRSTTCGRCRRGACRPSCRRPSGAGCGASPPPSWSPRLPGALDGVLGWVLFAAIIVTLVNWFVVLPIKGAPVGGGFRMPGVVVVPLVYAFWGFGMWLIARLVRAALGWR